MPTSKPMKEVHVRVVVDSVVEEKFHFESEDIAVGPNNLLTFKNDDDHYGFRIHYELHGADGYRFPDDKSEALFVEKGSRDYCPQTKSAWGQFKPVDVCSGNGGERRVLVVENKNDDKDDFAYTLQALKTGSKPLILDPPGSNQNGGEPEIEAGVATGVIIGAVAVVALLAVAFIALR